MCVFKQAVEFQIEYRGAETFTSHACCEEHDCYVWPIEEFLCRYPKMPAAMRRKLIKLNPNGKCESQLPQGFGKMTSSKHRWHRRYHDPLND